MAQAFQNEAPPLSPQTVEGQLREMYGRVAYTHKTHEKMADRYVTQYRLVKAIEIVASALGTGSLLVAVFGDSREGTIVGAIMSTILLALTLYVREGDLGERAQKHTVVAAKLWGLRERLLSLLIDIRGSRSLEGAREERDAINAALEEIYKHAPRTTDRAYRAAQKALKHGEELYFSQDELDRLLPQQIRSTERS